MKREVLDMLACVKCGAGVGLRSDAEIVCSHCGRVYVSHDSVFSFLLADGGPESSRRWRRKLSFFRRWREMQRRLPGTHFGLPLKQIFGEFSNVTRGRVLDIGCGSGDIRNFIRCDLYCGVDPIPLPGMDFPLFESIGERLPFKADSFDYVMMSQVLDHCIDPSQTLREAARVLRQGGEINVMQFVVDGDRRLFQYVKTKFFRAVHLSDRVHSWETKTSRFTSRSFLSLLHSVFEPRQVAVNMRLELGQVFAKIRVPN